MVEWLIYIQSTIQLLRLYRQPNRHLGALPNLALGVNVPIVGFDDLFAD